MQGCGLAAYACVDGQVQPVCMHMYVSLTYVHTCSRVMICMEVGVLRIVDGVIGSERGGGGGGGGGMGGCEAAML